MGNKINDVSFNSVEALNVIELYREGEVAPVRIPRTTKSTLFGNSEIGTNDLTEVVRYWTDVEEGFTMNFMDPRAYSDRSWITSVRFYQELGNHVHNFPDHCEGYVRIVSSCGRDVAIIGPNYLRITRPGGIALFEEGGFSLIVNGTDRVIDFGEVNPTDLRNQIDINSAIEHIATPISVVSRHPSRVGMVH